VRVKKKSARVASTIVRVPGKGTRLNREQPGFTKNLTLPVTSLLWFIHASHSTWCVDSPWAERGGILLVAPPGQLKTTMLYSLEVYNDALCTSDINIRSMKSVRDMVLGGRYRSMIFGELEKLYARNPATAQNIESHLKQFVEEGLRHFSHEDSAIPIMPARAMVLAGMTPSMFAKQYTTWNENGFLRRFLCIQYVLDDEKVILNAVNNWQRINLKIPPAHPRFEIPYNLTKEESKFVMGLMDEQQHSTPAVLMKKVAVVLKTRHPKEWKTILEDLRPALGKNGARLVL
jgi:hypothetical protein